MAQKNPNPSLTDLAAQVSKSAETIQAYLSGNNLPSLSFRQDAADRFPIHASQEVYEARVKLLEASQTLHDLALGPTDYLKVESGNSLMRLMTMNWIVHFRIAHHVPLDGTISYPELAAKASAPVNNLRRILRMAMMLRLFHEPEPEKVAHTVASRLLRGPAGEGHAWMHTQEMICIVPKVPEAHERYGDSTGVYDSPWGYHHGITDEQCYSWWQKNSPETMKRFTDAMSDAWKSPDRSIRYLIDGYDWRGLPSGNTVVDVGGNLGHISVALARFFPQLKFIVEDLATNTELGRKAVPDDVRDRISFLTHDFFTPQPVKDADIYLIHWVLLDHAEDRAALLLKQIIEVMKPGARIVIRDAVIPAPGVYPEPDELRLRCVNLLTSLWNLQREGISRCKADLYRITDMMAMTLTNARLRDMEDWRRLFALVSPKLKVESLTMGTGSTTTIMVLKLEE